MSRLCNYLACMLVDGLVLGCAVSDQSVDFERDADGNMLFHSKYEANIIVNITICDLPQFITCLVRVHSIIIRLISDRA